jgi:hypothetical protein
VLETARRNVAQAGLADRLELIRGEIGVLRKLAGSSLDFVLAERDMVVRRLWNPVHGPHGRVETAARISGSAQRDG